MHLDRSALVIKGKKSKKTEYASLEEKIWDIIWHENDKDCWYLLKTNKANSLESYPTTAWIQPGTHKQLTIALKPAVYRMVVGGVDDTVRLRSTCNNAGCCNPKHCEPM